MIYRLILPEWARAKHPAKRPVLEGEYSDEQLQAFNAEGYNVYFLPNYPSQHDPANGPVDGSDIDTFRYVFVDMDLKEGKWPSKNAFIEHVLGSELEPSLVVDSGNGVHAYWEVSDLDPMSYMRLQRRLTRFFNTDEAVSKIYQLMRCPGTQNTKTEAAPKPCTPVYQGEATYTCETLDKLLPPISQADEAYCLAHYNKTYRLEEPTQIEDKLPLKFAHLVKSNKEVKQIWSGEVDDRSKGDYRLGHIMFASGFTRDEALSVLVNSAKALVRAPAHRASYAENIVDKIWTFELTPAASNLASSVADILSRGGGEDLKGVKFPCYSYFDGTAHGFRLGQVIGLVAGVGVGKTAIALNFFKGFVEFNPDYDHLFVTLEQPDREIAERWRTMCGERTNLHQKVHVLSNYAPDGKYRHLSLHDIQDYVLDFQKRTGRKIGCCVIDHIGVLRKENRNGENESLMQICQMMKAFAIATNTLLVMQSQSNREKAGIGDLELFKDAAYGTQHFESFVDFLITLWQPLKRCYDDPACPPVTAYKFCKIRFKKRGEDKAVEDQCYRLFFDTRSETLRPMTQDEEKSFDFFANKALNLRKKDRKTDLVVYTTIKLEEPHGKISHHKNSL